MDVFLGSYKDGTNESRDLCYFAGVFFLIRIIFISLFGYVNSFFSLTIMEILISALLLATAQLQPQKSQSCTVM